MASTCYSLVSWLQLKATSSVEGVTSSSGNASDLLAQCEKLRDVVRKAEVQQRLLCADVDVSFH